MKVIVNEIAKKLRDALKDAIKDFEGLYVFGSQVRGDATEDSDIDIVVLFGDSRYEEPDDYYRIISKIMYDYNADLDIHPYTKKRLEQNYLFHNEVVNKGIFYGAE